MVTQFVTSPDHSQIAYDVCGSGPAIMLLHGGGSSRQEWQEAGYVERLKKEFTVISVDMRGHGESDKPTDFSSYSVERMEQDFLAVADACGVDRFVLCGYSLGGNVGRYLAVRSDRVTAMVMIGNPLGPGVSGEWLKLAVDFHVRWAPVVHAQTGSFDPRLLSAQDQEDIQRLSFPGEHIPQILALSNAMIGWPVVGPSDFHCPALWILGSENKIAMESFKTYYESLKDSKVCVLIFDGFTHEQEAKEVDQVLAVMLAFIKECISPETNHISTEGVRS
jgi:pimeloyl-ACP methyl ester carboxylesterase